MIFGGITMKRRKFFAYGGGLLLAFGIYGAGHYFLLESNGEKTNDEKIDDVYPDEKNDAAEMELQEIPKRKLGKTGYEITIFSLGGEAALLTPGKEEEARQIIEEAIEEGINYIDTAPLYGDGLSETNIGNVFNETDYREEVVLATKTHDRTYDGTMKLFEESLERLQTDYLDIYQLHNMTDTEDLKKALDKNGAIKALEELKNNGDIKNIGITSHNSPETLMKGLQEFDFDTTLINLNAADAHYNPFQTDFLDMALEKEVGIVAMKVLAKGNMLRDNRVSNMKDALGYTLTFPVSNAIVGISEIMQLRENIQLAKEFEPLSTEELERIENMTKDYYDEVNYR